MSNGLIQANVAYDTYAALEGVRVSALKEMGVSPLRYRYNLAHPKTSKPLVLGSAAHCAVLEPERFDRDHAVWSERAESGALRPRRGKDWEAFKAANDGRALITVDEYDAAVAMQAAIRGNENAMKYLRSGEPEVSMAWLDESGAAMKGRVDWITTSDGWPTLVGLKTSRDCRLRVFGKQAAQLGYHLSWAAYVDGHEAITGRLPKMIEIVVESAPPHDVAVYLIPSEILEQGRAEYKDLLAKLAECEASDTWPGAVPVETRLEYPVWAFHDDDDEDIGGIEGLRMKGDEDDDG